MHDTRAAIIMVFRQLCSHVLTVLIFRRQSHAPLVYPIALDFVSAFQVRQCYLKGTEEEGSAGKVVARLLNTAVSAGKRARSETSISKGEVPGVKIFEGG